MTTGCNSLPTKSEPPMLDAALRQPCPPVPQIVDGTKGSQLLWNLAMIRQYDDCARRHEAVVQAWPRQ